MDGEDGLEEVVEQCRLDVEVGGFEKGEVEGDLSGQLSHLAVLIAHEFQFLLLHALPHLLQFVEIVAQQRKLELSAGVADHLHDECFNLNQNMRTSSAESSFSVA